MKINSLKQKVEENKIMEMAREVIDLKQEAKSTLDTKVQEVETLILEGKEVVSEAKTLTKEIGDKFNTLTDEVVEVLQDIKSTGLKGDPGEPADEEAIEERLLAKIPKIEEIVKDIPSKDELVKEVIKQIPQSKPSLKIIQESLDLESVAEKIKEDLDIEGIKKELQKEIKTEVSRSKSYVHGGGFNNIANVSGTVSTGLDTLKFTGPVTVTQSGRTVTVEVSASGSGTVTSVATAGLISGGPITTTGTITTSMATNKLVGRGTAGTGVMEEITLGTGLSMTGTTLNVTGGTGTVTDFIFTDGNGFDGTVTNSTTTPTLSLTTTVTNTQLMYSNSGAIAGISGATTNGTAVTYTTGNLIGADVKASGSGGLSMLSNAGTQTALFGAGGGANNTFYGDIKADYATASTVPYFDSSKNLVSSAVTPTELGYVSGVTSAIQTQLNAKQATLSVSDTSEIDLTLSSNTLSASIVSGSIDETKLDTSVNASLDLADTSVQPNSSPTLATITTTGNIELGNASDTTLSRSAAGQLAVEGVQVATISNAVALSNKTIAYSTEPATDDTAYGETMGGILAGDTLAQWDLVYLDSTSGRWEKADADAIGTAGNVLLGLAMAAGTDGGSLTVLLKGIVRNDGWTWSGAGKVLYASTTAAAMSETAVSGEDDVVRVLGHTLSDDCVFFNPSVNWIIYKA